MLMKAAAIHSYGPPENLGLHEIPVPSAGPGQVLIRVSAASVNPVDTYVRAGRLKFITGSKFPLVPGRDAAGEVDYAGPGVSAFKPGDRVFGVVNGSKGGSYAEYAVIDETKAAVMPKNASFEEAASVPIAGLTALQSLRLALKDPANKHVLVYGASGGVGIYAVQCVKAMGGVVTAVCSGRNFDLVKKYGADHALDYTLGDALKKNGLYDAVLDFAGIREPGELTGVLKHGGRCVTTVFRGRGFLSAVFNFQFKTMLVRPNRADLDWFAQKMESKAIVPVIDKIYPLAEAAAAHRHVETKHSRGKVVLKIR